MPLARPAYIALIFLGIFYPEGANAQACTAKGKQRVETAQMLFANGKNAEAVSQLEAAADLCPNSCPVFLAIANAYAQMALAERSAQYLGYAGKLGCSLPEKALSAVAPGNRVKSVGEVEPGGKSFIRQKWALVVGIDQFQHENDSNGNLRIPKLNFSAKDAQDFAMILRDPAVGRFEQNTVILLRNQEATLERIRTEINRIAGSAGPDDLVVLFFSTHGSPAAADLATDQGKTGYIVTYNTDVDNLYATAFPMDELDSVVNKRLRAGRVVTFLDTCYSGDVTTHGGKALTLNTAQETIAAQIAQGKGRVVITSSRSTEQSWECEQYQNGCFTHQLLEAIKQKEGLSTITDIYRELQLEVPDVVMRVKRAPQNPMIKPDKGPIDIVIGTPIQ